jgi:predicted aldo/keto reductase-like oxidoreductase
MLAINGTWAGLNMVVYKACIDFIEIKSSHSGENLVYYIYKRCKKLGILHKILTLTRDNASNNDTTARHLHKKLSYTYDDHLEENLIQGKSMRFQGEASKINCLAYVDNLIVKAILKELGLSTHKEAVAFLDRVSNHGWKSITMPLAAGDIAVL